MTLACVHPTEQTFREAIIANPSDECVRLAFADWLLDEGRYEAAGRVRETARIRPEYRPHAGTNGKWAIWGFLSVNDCHDAPNWLFDSVSYDWTDDPNQRLSRRWPTEAAGMRCILAAILEGPP